MPGAPDNRATPGRKTPCALHARRLACGDACLRGEAPAPSFYVTSVWICDCQGWQAGERACCGRRGTRWEERLAGPSATQFLIRHRQQKNKSLPPPRRVVWCGRAVGGWLARGGAPAYPSPWRARRPEARTPAANSSSYSHAPPSKHPETTPPSRRTPHAPGEGERESETIYGDALSLSLSLLPPPPPLMYRRMQPPYLMPKHL